MSITMSLWYPQVPHAACSPKIYTAFVATPMLAMIFSLLLIIFCVLLYRATGRSDGIRGSNRTRIKQPRAEQSPGIGNSVDTSMPPATVVEPGQILPKALSIQPATPVSNSPAQAPPASPPPASKPTDANPVVAVASTPNLTRPSPIGLYSSCIFLNFGSSSISISSSGFNSSSRLIGYTGRTPTIARRY